jgi:bifunctional UDP-N-acetylglucosamine pyrophosphorylase / glucosamine-1-phosphate N-acetyltransferase
LERIATIILAAGKGTRMKSDLVKVLHPLLGVPMLSYVVDLSLERLGAERTIVVAGFQADRVQAAFTDPRIAFALQQEQLGTGHAVLQALSFLNGFEGTVLILCGDVPLLKGETVRSFVEAFGRSGAGLSVLTTTVENPTGYGRIVRDGGGRLLRITEEKDASPAEKTIQEINTGIYAVKRALLSEGLGEIGRENAQGEYYLTDLVQIADARGLLCTGHPAPDPVEVMGINTRADLARAEAVLRQEKLKDLMLSGVTVVDPGTTYVEGRVEVGRDTVLWPGCVLQGRTRIGEGCVIEPWCKIADSRIGNRVTVKTSSVISESVVEEGASIGPFAHLRPLADVRAGARVGNFVEVKKSTVGRGSKVSHLTYLGDTIIGEGVNVGAGTITCNYDGAKKHKTIIGDRVFVGSNVALVAPVSVGDDAVIGAGSTVTKDVPGGALAVARGRQQNVEGWKKRKG